MHTRPAVRVRHATQFVDIDYLAWGIIATEQGAPSEQLPKDAASRPNVNRERRARVLVYHLRAAIPQCHDLRRVAPRYLPLSESEVSDRQDVRIGHKEVVRLDVSVHPALRVAVGEAKEQLVHVGADAFWSHGKGRGVVLHRLKKACTCVKRLKTFMRR